MNAVALRHRTPHPHESVTEKQTRGVRRRALTSGHSQRREVWGFSIVQGTDSARASRQARVENLRSRFATLTRSKSAGRRPCLPCGHASLRKDGGPAAESRARENEPRGTAKCRAITTPPRNQPISLCWFAMRPRSYFSPSSVSQNSTLKPS